MRIYQMRIASDFYYNGNFQNYIFILFILLSMCFFCLFRNHWGNDFGFQTVVIVFHCRWKDSNARHNVFLLTKVISPNKWKISSTSFRSSFFSLFTFFRKSYFIFELFFSCAIFNIVVAVIVLWYNIRLAKVVHNKSVFHLTFQFTVSLKKLHQRQHRSNKQINKQRWYVDDKAAAGLAKTKCEIVLCFPSILGCSWCALFFP